MQRHQCHIALAYGLGKDQAWAMLGHKAQGTSLKLALPEQCEAAVDKYE